MKKKNRGANKQIMELCDHRQITYRSSKSQVLSDKVGCHLLCLVLRSWKAPRNGEWVLLTHSWKLVSYVGLGLMLETWS